MTYRGGCTSGIDADALDALFRAHHFPLVADRTRLKDSKEAWIHVTLSRVDETSDDRFYPLVEFSGAAAIFTFENSDCPTVSGETMAWIKMIHENEADEELKARYEQLREPWAA